MMRTLYLQFGPSSVFHRALWGEGLYSLFADRSDEYLLSHLVLDDASAHLARSLQLRPADVVYPDLFQELDPDVVYLERGLFFGSAGDHWRIPQWAAQGVCERGGVVIIADLDANIADDEKDRYSRVGTFMKSRHLYHRSADFAERPVVFRSENREMPMRIRPGDMEVAEWLKPAFHNVPEILVGNPVILHDPMAGPEPSLMNVAASGGRGATPIDLDRGGWFVGDTPFAGVDRIGNGHVVTIAASVSHDYFQKRCPHTGEWIVQLAQLLLDESANDRRRYGAPLRAAATLFLSHGSPDKPLVGHVNSKLRRRYGLRTWIDQAEMHPSDSLTRSVKEGLAQATHVILFWSAASAGRDWVRRELKLATRGLNRDKPVVVVRLDAEPLPASLADILYIDAAGMSPDQIADSVASTVDKLRERSRRRRFPLLGD